MKSRKQEEERGKEKKMIQKFRRFMKGRRGQGMSEYIIMVGLIAIAAIGMYTAFGGQIRNAMEALGNQLAGVNVGVKKNEQMAGQNATKVKTLADFGNDVGGSGKKDGK